MDTEQADNPLFNEHDLQYYRQHPKALESSSTKTLQRLSGRYTSLALIRTLASDLATKDAEMVTMRRKVEELSSLFRDHLCTAHGQSRLEADRTLHSLTMASAPAKQSLDDRLDEAATEDIVEPAPIDPFGDQHVVSSRENTPDIAITDPAPAESDSGYSTVRGVFSLFGGKSTVKARKEKRQSLGSLLSTTKTAPPPRSRGDSIGSSSLRPSIASASPGPVEMNAIVETEDLPPPLVTSRDIKAQYPAYVADVYGFIIDAGRTSELMNKNGAVVTRGTDSPIASSSSVKSDRLSMASRDTSPDRDTEAEAEPESTPWSSYLKFDRHTLGSLSWLPIATPLTANPEEVVSEAPMDLASDDVAERLQKQLAEDYQNLQKSRTIPWERFLSADNTEKEQAGWASVFRRGTISAPRPGRVTISEPGTAATNQARVERTRLILGGIPMHLRAKIWSAPILETLQHDPDEYASLVRSSSLAVDSTILAEINDDIPRTLANNVFFRSGKGRSALHELLCAFMTRRSEIGYCQGMNLIGGYLLLALPSTETAFWVFSYMIEHVLAETYFDATMRGASIEIAVLRSFVRDLIPRLASHLDALDIADQESVPYNWFLTAFASTLPVEGLYRVWDVVLALATQKNFLLRVAIALLKVNEERLLGIEDPFELRDFMDRSMIGSGVGIDGLIKAATSLGKVVREDEVKRRRRILALQIDGGGAA